MPRILVAGVALGLFISLVGTVQADYVYTTLDVPGAMATQASGINDLGQIVGAYDVGGVGHAFLLSNGIFTTLTPPNAVSAGALGINNLGQIVGTYGDFRDHGFLLSGGTYTTLDVPQSFGSLYGVIGTQATGINNAGQIVGYFTATTSPNGHTGDGAFLLDAGVYRNITDPMLGGGRANGINNLGQIVGTGNGPVGVLLSGGQYTKFLVPGTTETVANGINDAGQIVGIYANPSTLAHDYGFLLSEGIYTTLDFPGSIATDAYGINNAGDIVGSYEDAAGRFHGFLARPAPIPEPATLLLLSVGLCILLACKVRRSCGTIRATTQLCSANSCVGINA